MNNKNIFLEIEGTITITVKDFEKFKEYIKELERDNERLNKIIKLPEVVEVLHQSE